MGRPGNLPTITVLYSCEYCQVVDAKVEVQARTTEEVTDWMKLTCITTVIADHYSKSPQCRASKLTNLKIPTTGTSKIGGSVEN